MHIIHYTLPIRMWTSGCMQINSFNYKRLFTIFVYKSLYYVTVSTIKYCYYIRFIWTYAEPRIYNQLRTAITYYRYII